MKMEPIVSSETSATKSQTPGNYPKRNKLHLQHGESLRTRSLHMFQNVYFTKFQALLQCGILMWGRKGGELNTRIFRIQKSLIRSMVGVSLRTSCRQLFKELNTPTLAPLYIYWK